jgi:hypothetical protein
MENDSTSSPDGGSDTTSSESVGESTTSPLAENASPENGSSTLPPPPPPPPPPTGTDLGGSEGGNANKTIMLIAAVVLAVLLIGGGVALAVALGGGSEDKAESVVPASSTSTTIPRATTTRPPATTTTTTTTIPAPILTKEMCTETASEGQFAKDSVALVGTCMHFWAYVFQFDANTGRCSLLARYGDGPARYNFDFEGGTIRVDGSTGPGKVVQSNAGRVQLPPNSCVQLGPIVEGDKIEIWGIVQGVQSYSTTAGGSNTYTVIDLVDAYKY